jgi:hypothetical protein
MLRTGFCAVAVVGILVGTAGAQTIPGWDPNWTSASPVNIEISNLGGSFTTGGGANGLGVLTVAPKAGGPTITVHWDTGSDWSISGTSALLGMIGNLYYDESGQPGLLPGQASGWFNGDGVQLGADPSTDWRLGYDFGILQAWILSGSLDIYRVRELMDTGLLEGSGLVSTNGGLLDMLGLWPDSQTSLSSFTFRVNGNISDFSQSFTGDMFLTFWPDDDHGIPEPATLALLAGGVALAVIRRRR